MKKIGVSRLLLITLLCSFNCTMAFLPHAMGTIETSPITNSTGPLVNWNTTWSGTGPDVGSAMTIDTNGNIFVTGFTYSWGIGSGDVWIGSFTSTGSVRWNNTWGGPDLDQSKDVAVDGSGNVYVVGNSISWSSTNRLIVCKFNGQDGTLLWNQTWGGPGFAVGYAIALDTAGNVYVTGVTNNWVPSLDVLLQKYDPVGNLLWNLTWGGPASDAGGDMLLDAAGNIYVTGYTQNPDNDILLAKFDGSNGDLLGNSSFGGPGDDFGHGIAMDSAGNLFIIGETDTGSSAFIDMWLGRIDPVAGLVWNTTLGGPGNDIGDCISVTSSGDIYIGGWTDSWTGIAPTWNGMWAKYSEAGELLWSSIWGGVGTDQFNDMAIAPDGTILFAGVTQNWGGSTVEEVLLIDFSVSVPEPWWMINFLGVPIWAWIIIAAESVLIVIFIARRSKKGPR